MPGPSNKKRKSQGKNQKRKCAAKSSPSQRSGREAPAIPHTPDNLFSSPSPSPSPIEIHTPESERPHSKVGQVWHTTHNKASIQVAEERISTHSPEYEQVSSHHYSEDVESSGYYSHTLLQKPYIHDSGNGPRVRDVGAFISSRYFSQPPALDDPLCAEFAQEEVIQMLRTVLPEEMALILWYNKSRATSRICPACQRLYRIGDVLPDHAGLAHSANLETPSRPSSELEREQALSGSSLCFILASFNQCDPRTTRAAWGHSADEMDEASWEVLNGTPLAARDHPSISEALVMLIRMTRLDDLGLGQLCFPEVDGSGKVEFRAQCEDLQDVI